MYQEKLNCNSLQPFVNTHTSHRKPARDPSFYVPDPSKSIKRRKIIGKVHWIFTTTTTITTMQVSQRLYESSLTVLLHLSLFHSCIIQFFMFRL